MSSTKVHTSFETMLESILPGLKWQSIVDEREWKKVTEIALEFFKNKHLHQLDTHHSTECLFAEFGKALWFGTTEFFFPLEKLCFAYLLIRNNICRATTQ